MNFNLKTFTEGIRNFLSRYLNMNSDRENEEATVQAIRDGIEFKGATVWILICAIFIASLGLNTNSTAVIIGAMLISPLMGPIMGIGLGVGIYDFELIKKSFRNLGIATLFSVLTSTLYFLITPLSDARSELLARTAPTIYDVLIAFFGGGAGIVAMATRQKGNVIPGVAIATALMPPLCTAGFGLASGNPEYFFGAFYLFFINSVFIAFATTLGVKLMHFTKKKFIDPKRELTVERIVYTIIALTMAPSIVLTYNMVRQSYIETAAYQFVNTQMNFPDTQILSKSVTVQNGQRILNVSLIGKEVPEDSILAVESRMPQYGLENVRLKVSQGYQDKVDLKSLNSMMFQDIYKDSQEKIERQLLCIDSLKTIVGRREQLDSLGMEIAPELKVLFPKIKDIAISRMVYNDLDSMKCDTAMTVILTYSRRMPAAEAIRFREWIEARTGMKNVRILEN
ncbi:DUF389 domain-containing protein [Coprobacter tertius]|uniref:DUF389 domain-containing protein n=1 Tax=Coprobacter tertius TaxID=2944915 RepID=A0ABT1MDD7_9BACT|nr:DUF389 domain-containing protein [Coprobacter tertius]MCP9610654.1 DUF389 domain-containing protein [Coprobacter tertius]